MKKSTLIALVIISLLTLVHLPQINGLTNSTRKRTRSRLSKDIEDPNKRCHFIWQNACGNSSKSEDWNKYKISKRELICDHIYNKTYFFEKRKKTYADAVKNCKDTFESPHFADLAQLNSCGEYQTIKSIISMASEKDPKFVNGSEEILAWLNIKSEKYWNGSIGPVQSYERKFNGCPHMRFEHTPETTEKTTTNTSEAMLTTESRNSTENGTIQRYSVCQLVCSHPQVNDPSDEDAPTESPDDSTSSTQISCENIYSTNTISQTESLNMTSSSQLTSSTETETEATTRITDAISPATTTIRPVLTTHWRPRLTSSAYQPVVQDAIVTSTELPRETTKHLVHIPRPHPPGHIPSHHNKTIDHGSIFDLTKNITHDLQHKPSIDIDISKASDSLHNLANLIENEVRIWAKQGDNASIHGAHQRPMDPPPIREFTEHVVLGVSSALGRREVWDNMTRDQRSESALKFIDTVNKMTQSMGCIQASNETINSTCIKLETVVMNSDEIPSSMSFPLNADAEVKHQIHFTSNVPFDEPTKECPHHTISSVIFDDVDGHLLSQRTLARDKSLFRSQASQITEIMMNSKLVSFSVGEEKNESRLLPNNAKVRIIFKHIHPLTHKDEVACVFWDKMDNVWSDTNCSLVPEHSYKNQTMCECNHLTNFAVLMDISGRQKVDTVKSILSIVCCSISIIGLILTLISMLLVKGLRNRRCIITCNLCLCLLAVNLMVIFALDRTSDVLVCRIMSGTLLYLLLSSFAWMQLQGYLLYQMIILVFQSVGYVSNITLFIVGYIPSLIIVAIFVIITGPNGLYDPNVSYFCWISNRLHTDYIWAFAGPALLIIAINLIILVRSFRVAWQSQTARNCKNAKLITALKFLKGWTSLVILVGATWLTGLLYIHQLVPWSDYIFISLNALQGAFIFLFEILLNSKTRSLLTKLPVSKLLTSFGSSNSTSGNGTGSTGCSKEKKLSGHRWSKSSSSTSNISAITPPATWYTNNYPSGSPPTDETSESTDQSQNLAGIYSRAHEHYSQSCHRHDHTCDKMKDHPQVLPIPVAPPCIPEYFFKNMDKFTVTKVDQ